LFNILTQPWSFQPATQFIEQLSDNQQYWLLHPLSLTAKLKKYSKSAVQVSVFSEKNIHQANQWSRQVSLNNQNGLLIEAHTLIEQHDLQHELKALTELGNKPLGEYLFEHAHLQRDEILLAQLNGHWARKSTFILFNKPIIVAEMFYPAVFSLNHESSL
jgi:chorismate-pyruvate lyase